MIPVDRISQKTGADFPSNRVLRVVHRAIAKYNLQLDGLDILTEAATGWYRVTPVIAAMAGARRVIAVAKDNAFGTVAEATEQVADLARSARCAQRIGITERPAIERADAAQIVTNLGAVRPIDRQFARKLGPEAGVSLMFGARDVRPADIDAIALRAAGVPLCGVDEDGIDLFRWTGQRIAWWLTEVGVEIADSTLLVWGDTPQATRTASWLEGAGARVRRHAGENTPSVTALAGLDALLLMDDAAAVTPNGPLSPDIVAARAPGAALLEYAGTIDRSACADQGLLVYPRTAPRSGHVARTIGEILYAPVIELHTAGLKVGEILARHRIAGATAEECERRACVDGPGEMIPLR